MAYTPKYVKPYPGGWKNLPSKETPITAAIVTQYDEAITGIEQQLQSSSEMYDAGSEGSVIRGSTLILMNGDIALLQIDQNGNAVLLGNVTDGAGDSIASLKTLIGQVKELAEGASSAMVFADKAALDAWIAVEENTAGLKAGQVFLLEELEVPDYWWTGTGLAELEGRKVDLSGYVKTADLPTKLSQFENDSGYNNWTPDGTTTWVDESGILHAAGSGGSSDGIWYPNVSADGTLTWSRSNATDPPEAVNIKGDPGGDYTEADKLELEAYIDTKFQELTGDILGGAS